MKEETNDIIVGESRVDEAGNLESADAIASAGPRVGFLAGFTEDGAPLVDFAGAESGDPIPARSTVALNAQQLGSEVVMIFEQNDSKRPIIVGIVQRHHPVELPKPVDVQVDEDRVELTANREIVLRCGKSSITLTRAGKILIRGAYLLSRSSGVNRIKGGSVQIN